jgi:adenylate cyclase
LPATLGDFRAILTRTDHRGGDVDLVEEAWLELPSGRSVPIDGTCAIGRASGNHVVLEHEHVSRHHAVIRTLDGEGCWIVDLGSANGTYVNEQRVNRVRLHDGDAIAIGAYLLRFRDPAGGDAERAATPLGDTVHEIRTLPAWLFLADIEGSTEIGRRLGPLEMDAVYAEWSARCRAVLLAHGGIFDKPLGDGFFAFWPAGDAATASVGRALLDFTHEQRSAPLPFRMVLHLGTAFAGGEIASGLYRLFGPDVNFTFRMEVLAKQLRARCLLSASARAALGDRVEARSTGSHDLPGLAGSHEFFRL